VKITYLIDSLRRHGSQTFLARLATGLGMRGHQQTVIVLNNEVDSGLARELAAARVDLVVVGKLRLLLGGGPLAISRLLRGRRDHLIVTLLPYADSLGRLAAGRSGCANLISSIRARNVDKPSWQRRLDRRTMPLARRVIFNSRELVEWSQTNEGVAAGQVVVIPNGIEDFTDPKGDLRASRREALGLEDVDIVLGAVGRLYPQKDYPTLLQAFARLVEIRGHDLKLFIVGDGPERRNLERQAQDLKVAELIHWAGHQDDLRAWYASFDIFLHTAVFEGMPNAVMEAMSAGLPVVASDVDGCRELIEHGRTGWLCPPGQPGAFSTAVLRILDDRAAARDIGQAARRRVQSEYSISRMVDRYESVFQEVLTTPA
jgi:glycosyltransferase involved in cell wall biosynthesis